MRALRITTNLEEFVQIRMDDLNLNKTRLAGRIGVTFNHYTEVMAGKRVVTEKFLSGAARALDTDVQYLEELMFE